MHALPFKLNQDRRHHIPKQKHKVTNWREYNASLRQRGSLTVVSDGRWPPTAHFPDRGWCRLRSGLRECPLRGQVDTYLAEGDAGEHGGSSGGSDGAGGSGRRGGGEGGPFWGEEKARGWPGGDHPG